MGRAWRQELAAARRAQRDHCDACDAARPAVAVDVLTYEVRPARSGWAAIRASARAGRVSVCPRHLRLLKEGRVLCCGTRAVALGEPSRSARGLPPQRGLDGQGAGGAGR